MARKTAKRAGVTGGTGNQLVKAEGRALTPVLAEAGGIAREGGTTLIAGQPYLAHGEVVPAVEVYHVEGLKPRGDGPWLGEADKVAWRDEATGYECIMLRSSTGGHLGGYVGVPVGHPLHGYAAEAIPQDLGIEAHGGVTYAAICQDGPTPRRRIVAEARRICHVPPGPTRYAPIAHATDYRVGDGHVWWFGFECDHLADVKPGDAAHAGRAAAMGVAQIYRDDAYVFGEVTSLAAQLRAVADGVPVPPRAGPPLPPASLDPDQS